MTRHVCFVTDELYPFTAGGIGRLIHNLIRDSAARGADTHFHLLVPEYAAIDAAAVAVTFGDCATLHRVGFREPWAPAVETMAPYPPVGAFTDTRWHAESLELMRALKRLAAGGIRFDVIEFSDYRGWAFCTIQEKRLGLDFAEAEIAVRVHGAHGLLQKFEKRALTDEELGRFEIERKSLYDADRVIAHLAAVADFSCSFYGFDPRWREKVTIQFPPALWPVPAPRATAAGTPPKDLLFPTKLQPVKGPELFVRAAAILMRREPGFTGRAVLACHAGDPEYRRRIQDLVPPDLRERIVLIQPGPDRERLLGQSIVVVPSQFEAFNLTAYEASAAGATLVVNGACVAFGEGTPFRDGENCYKFDGTVEGLAEQLARAWRAPALRPVEWAASEPYWEHPRAARAPAVPSSRLPRVSVVIPNFNLAKHLPETLASVNASDHPDIEVIVVDDASTHDLDRVVIERLERSVVPGGALKVIRNPVNRGLPASRNIGVRAASGDYVLPLDADDCISPTFLGIAVRALEANREHDFVVPTCGYFSTDEELGARKFCDYAVFLGDVPTLGLVANRFSCATSLIRRSVFDGLRYDERLSSYEDWDFYRRAALAGHRFLVTNEVHFFYRRRPGSMIQQVNPQRHLELSMQLAANLPSPLPASVHPFATLIPTARLAKALAEAAAPVGSPSTDERPLRYSLVDFVNSKIKQMPVIHPVLRRTTQQARRLLSLTKR